MANVSEQPLPASTRTAIEGSNRQGLRVLGLDDTADPKTVIAAIDKFADAWQQGTRPPDLKLDEEDAPFALGSLWGEQLVRAFQWEWAFVTFHDHGNSKAPGVLAPDRSLAVYPIHFLIGCFRDPRVDVTVALAFNMLAAGKVVQLPPKGYVNLMDGVRRIVPRR
jgi:hypothetical protein